MHKTLKILVFLHLVIFAFNSNAALVSFDFTARVTSVSGVDSGSELDGIATQDIVTGSITYEDDVAITSSSSWTIQSLNQFSNLSTFTINAGSFNQTIQLSSLQLRNDKPEQDSLDDGDYVRFDSQLIDNFTKRFTLRLWDQIVPYNDGLDSLAIDQLAQDLVIENFWNRQVFVSADGGSFAATLQTMSVQDQRQDPIPSATPVSFLGLGLAALVYFRRKRSFSIA